MTTASVTHTPGPWATAGISNPQTNPRMSVWGPKAPDAQSGEWIAKDIRPANAEFIVRACNSFDALVEAAKHAVMEWRLHGQLTDSCRKLDAAVAKAEGR